MGTELKADSWHRYVLYKRDDYMRATVGGEAAKRTAIDAGRKFTLAAYADVWAKDAALVRCVRRFLGNNFHWHDRLARSGSDLEVVQMLQRMVRSNVSAIVVISTEIAARRQSNQLHRHSGDASTTKPNLTSRLRIAIRHNSNG